MKTSENNLGLISNQAEIYEAYNDLGLADIDSTTGNKASTILVVALIGVGAYFIKKKVLR